MKKLTIGLLAAVALAIAAAPAEAAKKGKKSAKGKDKAEVSKSEGGMVPLASFGCFLSGMAGTKPSGPGCGR